MKLCTERILNIVTGSWCFRSMIIWGVERHLPRWMAMAWVAGVYHLSGHLHTWPLLPQCAWSEWDGKFRCLTFVREACVFVRDPCVSFLQSLSPQSCTWQSEPMETAEVPFPDFSKLGFSVCPPDSEAFLDFSNKLPFAASSQSSSFVAWNWRIANQWNRQVVEGVVLCCLGGTVDYLVLFQTGRRRLPSLMSQCCYFQPMITLMMFWSMNQEHMFMFIFFTS